MERLKELRKENNKTQDDIAKYLGTSAMNYSRYENGKVEPNIETLCKLADFYNISLDFLVNRKLSNDIGFVTKEQLDLFRMIKQLTMPNFYTLQGYVLRLLQEQIN